MKTRVLTLIVAIAVIGAASATWALAGSRGDDVAEPGPDDHLTELLVAAATELLVNDNTFGGGGNPFGHVFIVDHLDGAILLTAGQRSALAAAIGRPVEFIADENDAIAEGLQPIVPGAVILTLGDPVITRDRAEIALGMWCGGLCGTWLTYGAELGAEGWQITGPIGPIAVS